MELYFLISLFLSIPITSHSLNILFYVPTLSHSHISFNTKLAEVLTSYGHSVTVLLAQVDETLLIENVTDYAVLRKKVGVPRGHLRQVLWSNPGPYEDSSPLNPHIFYKLLKVSRTFVTACENIAFDSLFLDSLKEQRFDVGLVEQYDSCGFGIFKAIGIDSTVWLSATAIYRPQAEALGVYLPYSYVPELFAHFSDKMSFLQKVINVLIGQATSFVLDVFVQGFQSRIFNQDLASISKETSSLMINSVPFFDYSMPSSHQFSNIGGITVDKKGTKKLDPVGLLLLGGLKKLIFKNGFVLVSFGGIARTIDMTSSMQQIFFDSFSKFPHITFIVKYEFTSNSTATMPDNVILTPWIPQLPLMAHKNYKTIITHGGWSSILETTMHSKPMILMPLFADHAKNSKVAESKGVAVLLDKMRLSQRRVVHAINTILTNPRYTQNCEKFSRMFSDTPIPHEDLIEWRIRQAAKPSRKAFARHLRPKEPDFSLLKISFILVPAFLVFFTKRFR
ncbi:CRE-UGT-59 protein [Caenorhabditis remanei]|uniref:glucuronosyltransferase n=1 Tax=Caenorhabditis remanei TaxID=31234 RepID=E3M5H7_CAERE|nr:CRE-UGT-59 protein [Caenorhabditis remanei]